MTEVVRVTPSEVLRDINQADSSVRKLVLSGYDLTESSASDPIHAASVEYDYPDDRAAIFLVKEGSEALGSLTLILWKDSLQDKRGSKFWPKLRELDPSLAERATKYNPLACDVGGVVTDPKKRGQGIGKMLYSKALEILNPSILVGQTKTPGAVNLRSRLDNFRTFYGNTEVTFDHPQGVTAKHSALVQAYLHARDIDDLLPEGLVFMYEGGIASTIPDVAGFPSTIEIAFKPLIAAQKRLAKTGKTVMSPLISVRSELL